MTKNLQKSDKTAPLSATVSFPFLVLVAVPALVRKAELFVC